ncbi:transglutaminase domain-containing protein [bacterium]|nr:transglutaminase domain-containing protein [bacterium]
MNWRYHLVTVFSLAVLAVGVTWLHKVDEARAFLATRPSFSLVDGRITLREHFSGKYLNGKKVGYTLMRLQQDTQGDAYYRSHVESQFSLSVLGQEVRFSQIADATLHKDLSLQSLHSVFRTVQAQDTVTTATVKGPVLEIANRSMDQVTRQTKNTGGAVYTLEALYPLIMQRGLRPGAMLAVKIFEPTLGDLVDVTVRVIGPRSVWHRGEPVAATLVEIDVLGTTQRSWLRKDGSPAVEETSMGGLAMVGVEEPAADAPNLARSHLEYWRFDSVVPAGKAIEDLFTSTLIDSNVRFARAEEVFSATYRLIDVPEGSFLDGGERQTLVGSSSPERMLKLRVESPAYEALAARVTESYRLGQDLSDRFADELASSLRIQSEHPDIRRTAREIVGEEIDPYRAALKIHHWLADEAHIRKEIRATLPDALEVLATRSGDCNEHAVLFAALGRAVGLPTKMVTGIVYSPDLGKFGYHAWNEVLIGLAPPTWYALDATLDQTRVDATHIKIAEGDIDQQVKIVPLVGKMKLYVEGYD